MTGKKSLMRLKKLIVKVTKCMQLLRPIRLVPSDDDEDESNASLIRRPGLVPEGHFAVVAGKGEEEQRRFVVELSCLRNPALLKLLKEAEDEYGFQQDGALVVPCTPQHLHQILKGDI